MFLRSSLDVRSLHNISYQLVCFSLDVGLWFSPGRKEETNFCSNLPKQPGLDGATQRPKRSDRHWKSLFRLQTIRLGSDHNLVDNLWRCRRGLVIGRYLATRHFWHLVSKIDAKFTLTCCFRSLGRGSIHLKTFLLISHDQTFLGVSCEVLWQKNFWSCKNYNQWHLLCQVSFRVTQHFCQMEAAESSFEKAKLIVGYKAISIKVIHYFATNKV